MKVLRILVGNVSETSVTITFYNYDINLLYEATKVPSKGNLMKVYVRVMPDHNKSNFCG